MLVVVPAEEVAGERSGVLDRVEPGGEPGSVFQRLEVRFGIRVVAGCVRPVVGLGDPEVGEQERDRFAGHRAAAVGVNGQLPAVYLLLVADLRSSAFATWESSRCWTVQPTA